MSEAPTIPTPLPAVRKQVLVPLPPKDAFRLFADGIDRWWPIESHSLSASRGERPRRVAVEPREGGRVYEVMADGTRADWGTVTRWEEGQAIGLDWYVGRHPSEATQVLVTFAPDGDGTRVDLVHGGWNASSQDRRDGYEDGWSLVLCQRFAAACQAVSA